MHIKVFIVLIIVSKIFCSTHSTERSDVQNFNQTFEASDGNRTSDNAKKNIRKCCPFGLAYDTNARECMNATVDFVPPPVYYEYDNDEIFISGENISSMFNFVFGTPNCNRSEKQKKEEKIVSNTRYKEKLIKDGTLSYKEPELGCPSNVDTEDYCLDNFVFTDKQGNRFYKRDTIICDDMSTTLTSFQKTRHLVHGICMVISCVFILATVAVYVFLLDIFSMHGRLIVTYLLCMFIALTILAYLKIKYSITHYNCPMDLHVCYSLGFPKYFFLMSAFFWLNVMSYDVWLTFGRGLLKVKLDSMSVNARYLVYVLYAFGIPMLMTTLLAILNFADLPENDMLPNLKVTCFLYGKSLLLYQTGPMGFLSSLNFVFFILTWKKMAEESNAISDVISSRRRAHTERCKIIVNLSIVMGINWLFEIISTVFGTGEGSNFLNWFFFIFDTYNVLNGLIIFIVLICKRCTLKRIRKRYEQIKSGELRVNSGISVSSHNSRAQTNLQRNGRMESVSSATTSFSTSVNRHASVESAPTSGTLPTF